MHKRPNSQNQTALVRLSILVLGALMLVAFGFSFWINAAPH